MSVSCPDERNSAYATLQWYVTRKILREHKVIGLFTSIIQGLCKHWCNSLYPQSSIPITRAGTLTEYSNVRIWLIFLYKKVSTLNLAGVSHLVLVPSLRTSTYISTLVTAFPSLLSSKPGEIQIPELSQLRHLIVVDNTRESEQWEKEVNRLKSAVDFREVLVWREDGSESRQLKKITEALDCHDVMNLQFTRSVASPCFDRSITKSLILAVQPELPKPFRYLLFSLSSYTLLIAVKLTHHNLLNNGLSIGRAMRLTPDDILCTSACLSKCNVLMTMSNL